MEHQRVLRPQDVLASPPLDVLAHSIPHLEIITSANRALFNQLVQEDAKLIRENHKFHIEERVLGMLLPQSGEGRARSAHGAFKADPSLGIPERRYDASIEDVLIGLEKDIGRERRMRQAEINHIFEWSDLATTDDKPLTFTYPLITDPHTLKRMRDQKKDHKRAVQYQILTGNRHLGPIYHHGRNINADAVLLGEIVGPRIDSRYWRSRTEDAKGITMNTGSTEPIDLRKLRRSGYRLDWLANFNHNPNPNRDPTDSMTGLDSLWNIEVLQEKGIIISNPDPEAHVDDPNIVNAYVRHQKGYGIDDDSAFIFTGLALLSRPYVALRDRFNGGKPWSKNDVFDVCIGWYLADFVDTFDKCASRFVSCGQDEELSNHIVDRLDLDRDEQQELAQLTIDVIDLSRNYKGSYLDCPSSSQRYFGESRSLTGKGRERSRFSGKKGASTICAFETHMAFASRFYDEIKQAQQKGWNGSAPAVAPIRLGFNFIKGERFYEHAHEKFVTFMKGIDQHGSVTSP